MKDYVDVLLDDYLGDDTVGEELEDEPTLPGEDGDE